MKRNDFLNLKSLFAFLMCITAFTVSAQNINVSGTVTDNTGLTVIGATIVVEGNFEKGTVTDIDGKYLLKDVPSNATLQFSYVGLQTKNVPVNGKAIINVVLNSDIACLD